MAEFFCNRLMFCSLNLVILRTALVYGPYIDYGSKSSLRRTAVNFILIITHRRYELHGGSRCLRVYEATYEMLVSRSFPLVPVKVFIPSV